MKDPKANSESDLDQLALPLPEEVLRELLKVPSEEELKGKIPDQIDRARARQRRLVAAALEACIRVCGKSFALDDGAILVDDDPISTAFTELSAAKRHLLHDIDRLDAGKPAELILSPVTKESIDAATLLNADRRLMLTWLAVIDVYVKGRDTGFKTQKELLEFAAVKMDRSPRALKGALHAIRKACRGTHKVPAEESSAPRKREYAETGFGPEDCKYFEKIADSARSISHRHGNTQTAFELLLPIAFGFSKVTETMSLPASRRS